MINLHTSVRNWLSIWEILTLKMSFSFLSHSFRHSMWALRLMYVFSSILIMLSEGPRPSNSNSIPTKISRKIKDQSYTEQYTHLEKDVKVVLTQHQQYKWSPVLTILGLISGSVGHPHQSQQNQANTTPYTQTHVSERLVSDQTFTSGPLTQEV